MLLDAAAADVAGQVVAASQLPSEAFRHGRIQNRPAVAANARAVGFQYFRFGIGGAEKVTRILLEQFRQAGRRAVLYVDELVSAEEELELPEGVTCKVVPMEPRERAGFWMREVAEEKLCCVVYGTWLSPRAPLDCLAIQAAGAALVLETHGAATYLFDCPRNGGRWDDMLRCAYTADLMVCLSEADRLFWQTFNPNVRRVMNPIDPDTAAVLDACADAPSYDVVFCGRLDPHEKRPDQALRVFAHARVIKPGIRMAFVGDGPARGGLEGLADELGCSGDVDFLGFVGDPRPIVANAGVLVMSSPSEGCSLVISEAACLGTPLVAYEMPHLANLAGNGGAVQVPQGDWEAGGSAVARILGDEGLRAQMSAAGRAFYRDALASDQGPVWLGIVEDAVRIAAAGHESPEPQDDPLRALVFNAVAASRRESVRCEDFEDRMNAEWRRANEAEAQLRALRESRSYRLAQALAGMARKLKGLTGRG